MNRRLLFPLGLCLVLVVIMFSVAKPADTGSNLIQNGTFTGGASPWYEHTSYTTGYLYGGSACLNPYCWVVNTGNYGHSMQDFWTPGGYHSLSWWEYNPGTHNRVNPTITTGGFDGTVVETFGTYFACSWVGSKDSKNFQKLQCNGTQNLAAGTYTLKLAVGVYNTNIAWAIWDNVIMTSNLPDPTPTPTATPPPSYSGSYGMWCNPGDELDIIFADDTHPGGQYIPASLIKNGSFIDHSGSLPHDWEYTGMNGSVLESTDNTYARKLPNSYYQHEGNYGGTLKQYLYFDVGELVDRAQIGFSAKIGTITPGCETDIWAVFNGVEIPDTRVTLTNDCIGEYCQNPWIDRDIMYDPGPTGLYGHKLFGIAYEQSTCDTYLDAIYVYPYDYDGGIESLICVGPQEIPPTPVPTSTPDIVSTGTPFPPAILPTIGSPWDPIQPPAGITPQPTTCVGWDGINSSVNPPDLIFPDEYQDPITVTLPGVRACFAPQELDFDSQSNSYAVFGSMFPDFENLLRITFVAVVGVVMFAMVRKR